MVQAACRYLVCHDGWAGFNAKKAGWTQCPFQNILQGSCAWVYWTQKDKGRRLGSYPGHWCGPLPFRNTQDGGPSWVKGGKLALAEGVRLL